MRRHLPAVAILAAAAVIACADDGSSDREREAVRQAEAAQVLARQCATRLEKATKQTDRALDAGFAAVRVAERWQRKYERLAKGKE